MKIKTILLISILYLSGCSSLVTHIGTDDQLGKYLNQDVSDVSKTYSGFCFSLGLIINNERGNTKSEIIASMGFYDMPVSAAIDTLLLPIDLSSDLHFYIKNGYYPSLLCSRLI